MVNHIIIMPSRVGEPRGPGTRGARLNPKKCEQCSGEVLGLIPRQDGEGETEGEMGEGNEAGQGSNRDRTRQGWVARACLSIWIRVYAR